MASDQERMLRLADFDLADLESWDINYSIFTLFSLAEVYFSFWHWCGLLFLTVFHARVQHIPQTEPRFTPQRNSTSSGDSETFSTNKKSFDIWHIALSSKQFIFTVYRHFPLAEKTPIFFFLFYWSKIEKRKKKLLRNIFLSSSIFFLWIFYVSSLTIK